MSFKNPIQLSIGLIFFIVVTGCLLYFYQPTPLSDRGVVIGKSEALRPVTNIIFEIATSSAAQERGLGGRKTIADNYGMLFVFKEDGKPGFWMKDMLTSIDMVWLTDAGVIASITASVAPETYPNVFYPPRPIRYVLETRAGFSQSRKWMVGTKILLPLPYRK
jgi:uncharacterized membrane protein (UPF0127 family)